MEWEELKPVELDGAAAEVINRRIATHLKFREQIDANDPAVTKMRTFAGGTLGYTDTKERAIRESLSREIFIRRDLIQLLKKTEIDTTDAEAAMVKVRQQFEETR